MIVKNLNDFPKEARPCLMFSNLDEWMNNIFMGRFLEEIPTFAYYN